MRPPNMIIKKAKGRGARIAIRNLRVVVARSSLFARRQ